MENLKITIIQPDIVWEQPAANLENYNKLLSGVGKTDLIVLPEMFSTGFSMHPGKLYEDMNGMSVQWMKLIATRKNVAITGSLIIKDDGKFFNRCLWVFPDGSIQHYDKHHLFTMSDEHLNYSSGDNKLIVEYKGWRFCPLVCYDLRFPVWSRNNTDYDVLLYMANWPAVRHHVWKCLLVARAIENQAYCVGVNRVGTDAEGKTYRGDSVIIDPKGFATFLGNAEKVETFTTSYSDLVRFREVFPVLNDRDRFKIILSDIQNKPKENQE